MIIGLAGKTNCGKTTLFNALTHGSAQVGNYPFTTINPNLGVAFVAIPCVEKELNVKCTPKNGKCEQGIRFIPVNVIDVAGLVPDAHLGKGLGNQFLNDLAQADALICVVDASGGTDDEGKPCAPGLHDPFKDVQILEQELDYWIAGIIERNAQKARGKKLSDLAQLLSGIRVNESILKNTIASIGFSEDFSSYG